MNFDDDNNWMDYIKKELPLMYHIDSVLSQNHFMTSFIDYMLSDDGKNNHALKVMGIKNNYGITIFYQIELKKITIAYGNLDDLPLPERHFSASNIKECSDYLESLLNNEEERKEAETLIEDETSFPKPIPKEEELLK